MLAIENRESHKKSMIRKSYGENTHDLSCEIESKQERVRQRFWKKKKLEVGFNDENNLLQPTPVKPSLSLVLRYPVQMLGIRQCNVVARQSLTARSCPEDEEQRNAEMLHASTAKHTSDEPYSPHNKWPLRYHSYLEEEESSTYVHLLV